MNNLKNAVGLLNAQAPEGEFLAYINPDEAKMLKDAGGSGLLTPQGIPSYRTAYAGQQYSGGSKSSGGRTDSQSQYGGGSSYDSSQNTSDRGTGFTYGANSPTVPDNNTGGGGNDNREQYGAVTQYTTTKQAMGTVDAEDEYLAPDIDHYKATQKAIKESISGLGDNYQADYNDWSKEDQQAYQDEMNKLKGTEGVNYSFYAGNEGTVNLSFKENWNDTYATNPNLNPALRFLVAAGRTIQQNATTDYGTGRYGGAGTDGSSMYAVDGGGWLGRIFNADGSVNENISESEAESIYNEVQNQLPFIIGGTQPKDSMVNQYFANTSNNLGISNNFMASYDQAKKDLAKTLNMTTNASQFGYNANMSASNIYYNYLKEQGLL